MSEEKKWKTINQPQGELEPLEFWQFNEKGDTLISVLENFYPNKGKYKNNILYIFRDENGKKIGLMGTTILNHYLPNVVGKEVKIEYLGETEPKKGGRPYHNFSIAISEEDEKVEVFDFN
jgi:hypothetical protein